MNDDEAASSWFAFLLRSWTLRRIARTPTSSPIAAAAILSVLWLLTWVAVDWWERRPSPLPTADGIPFLAWYVGGVLALAIVLRGRSHDRPAFAASLLLACGIVPVPLLLMTLLTDFLQVSYFWGTCAVAAMYIAAYFERGLRPLYGRPRPVLALLGMLFVAAFVYASIATNAAADVWVAREEPAVPDDDVAEREAALFEQADRIDEALQAVHRDSSPQPQAFFLGFAGVGAQKVFAQEIDLASRVIGQLFTTGERSLALINDERDLSSTPLASVSGLNYALQGLAARMDLDRDVLFLAISSHGSADPMIAVENSDFPLSALSRDALVEALRQSGIKWRVILISACYAGGFVEPLRDPRTIVITAAAADRTSFGCSNDSELTYFGEAFYRDALPAATSLRKAFDTAKALIAAREHAEGETPSDPQAYFGAEIEAHLASMQNHARAP